jgi:hypothetical protein
MASFAVKKRPPHYVSNLPYEPENVKGLSRYDLYYINYNLQLVHYDLYYINYDSQLVRYDLYYIKDNL